MTIAFDVGSVTDTESVVASVDISFTPGAGSDMILMGLHAVMRDSGIASGSVTYDPGGGDEASFVSVLSIRGPNTLKDYDHRLWILKDVDIVKSTAKTIRAAVSTSTARQGIAVSSFTGVDQTTATSSASSNEDKTRDNTTALSISSAVGDMVIGTALEDSDDPTPVTPGAEWDPANFPMSTSGKRWNAAYWSGAASVDVQFEWNNNNRNWSQLGINLNQVAAAAAVPSLVMAPPQATG